MGWRVAGHTERRTDGLADRFHESLWITVLGARCGAEAFGCGALGGRQAAAQDNDWQRDETRLGAKPAENIQSGEAGHPVVEENHVWQGPGSAIVVSAIPPQVSDRGIAVRDRNDLRHGAKAPERAADQEKVVAIVVSQKNDQAVWKGRHDFEA